MTGAQEFVDDDPVFGLSPAACANSVFGRMPMPATTPSTKISCSFEGFNALKSKSGFRRAFSTAHHGFPDRTSTLFSIEAIQE
jgi:hypothetical protein